MTHASNPRLTMYPRMWNLLFSASNHGRPSESAHVAKSLPSPARLEYSCCASQATADAGIGNGRWMYATPTPVILLGLRHCMSVYIAAFLGWSCSHFCGAAMWTFTVSTRAES